MSENYFYVSDVDGSSIHINPPNSVLKDLKIRLDVNKEINLDFIVQLIEENEYRTHVFYKDGEDYKYFFEYEDPSSQSFYSNEPIIINGKDVVNILKEKIGPLDDFGQYCIQTINKYHSYIKLDKLPSNKKNIKNNKI